jgi:hypothetical protein
MLEAKPGLLLSKIIEGATNETGESLHSAEGRAHAIDVLPAAA